MTYLPRLRMIAPALLAIFSPCLAQATEATVVGDTYVNSSSTLANYGTATDLAVGHGSTTLIQFDLSSLPAGTTASQIGKATVRFFVSGISGQSQGAVQVQPVTSAWSESTVTYATIPSLGSSVASFTPVTVNQFVDVDITSLVKGWVTTPSSNHGLALTSATAILTLDSKEATNTSHPALIDVTVASQGATGPAGPQGPPGTPGTPGPIGPQGNIGPAGTPGSIGPMGPIGPAGPAGAPGSIGPAGATGSAGATGATGAAGSTGPQGPTGPAGPFVGGTYSATVDYPAGSVVESSSTTYLALKESGPDNGGAITPGTNTSYWVATGSSSAGTPNYAYLSTTLNNFVPALAPITFTNSSISGGFAFVPPSAALTATTAGTYYYSFQIPTSGADNPQWALDLNGVPVTTEGASGSLESEVSGQGIITLSPGDILAIVNISSGIQITFSLNPGDVSASLVLVPVTGAQGAQGATGPAGPTGNTGSTGPAGPQGPSGPTGPEGPAGTSTALVFTSSFGQGTLENSATLTTNSGGMASIGALMPISGYVPTAVAIKYLDENGGQAYFGNIYGGLLQILPSQMTFTKMNAVINPQNTQILVEVTETITAQLYRFARQGGAGQLVVVPGAACTFTDASTLQNSQPTQTYAYIVPPSELGVCSATFSATIPAGDSLMWLISMTSSTTQGQALTQTLNIDASISLSQ